MAMQDEGREKKRAKLTVNEPEPDDPGFMDPRLWENLQDYIPLKMIFAKLPLREFFQLRLVCREWNQLAGDREFLEAANPKPIQKPYFHLCRRGPDYQINGLLTYTSWSKEWNYTCLGHYDELDSMIALEGLIYSSKANDNSVRRVFNIHSRVWHILPPLVPWVQSYYEGKYLPVVALKVDTSTHPYEFQVIRTGGEAPTQTYDSRTNTWHLGVVTSIVDTPYKATCAQVSDAVYVRSDLDEVFCYKIKEDSWYSFDVPPGHISQNWLCGVGAWKEKVYHLSQVHFGKHPNMRYEIIMYVEEDRQLEWEEYDRMPEDLLDWLTYNPEYDPTDLEILSSYCDGMVLIYSYYGEEGEVGKFVLYNLETKVWEDQDIPDGLVQPFMDDEDSETFHKGYSCFLRKKGRNRAMKDADEANDTDELKDADEASDTEFCVKENKPATLDEWIKFLDSE